MDKPKATGPLGAQGRPWRLGWLLEITVAVIAVVLLCWLGIPALLDKRANARENEAKSSLHTVQLGLERYAVDNAVYPEFLIGGEGAYSSVDANGRFVDICASSNVATLADPLLRDGYLTAYPKNPFARAATIHSTQVEYGDPLRNGTEDAKLRGTRFGAQCNLMGNVLADCRYPGTYAEYGYPFYDLWPEGARRPKFYLPGAFFYRSFPSLVATVSATEETPEETLKDISAQRNWWSWTQTAHAKRTPWVPTGSADSYVLALYGTYKKPGEDVLGNPQDMVYRPGSYVVREEGVKEYWFRDPNPVTPFAEHFASDNNPNGIPDCIILLLSPGQDW